MKLISMHVNDVIKLSRGDEVIEVMVTDSDRQRKKTHLGVKADRVWKIELFRGIGRKPEAELKEKKDGTESSSDQARSDSEPSVDRVER